MNSFVEELRAAYGSRLQQVILYGSRARGDADADADIDTLVILDSLEDFREEFARISSFASRISLEFDVLISALPVGAEKFMHDETPLLISSRRGTGPPLYS